MTAKLNAQVGNVHWLAILSLLSILLLNSYQRHQNRQAVSLPGQTAVNAKLVSEQILRLQADFEAFQASTSLRREMSVEPVEGGLMFQLNSNNLFIRGATDIRKPAARNLATLANWIRSNTESFTILVEGHTDQSPITSGEFARRYPSNWELSTARASAVVRLFTDSGVPSERLVVLGYGDSRPVATERSPAGEIDYEAQARNRRVVLLLVHNEALAAHLNRVPKKD